MTIQSVLEILTPTLLAFVVALVSVGIKWASAKAAWFEARAHEWETIANEAKNAAQEAKVSSEGNRKLLEENTKMTRNIEKQSDGVNDKLRDIAVQSAFEHGKMKEALKTKYDMEDDELDELTKVWMQEMKDRT